MSTEYTDRDYLRDRIWDAERARRLAVVAQDPQRIASAKRRLAILWADKAQEYPEIKKAKR